MEYINSTIIILSINHKTRLGRAICAQFALQETCHACTRIQRRRGRPLSENTAKEINVSIKAIHKAVHLKTTIRDVSKGGGGGFKPFPH